MNASALLSVIDTFLSTPVVRAYASHHLPMVKYSEDQPRDDNGRWGDGGGAESGDANAREYLNDQMNWHAEVKRDEQKAYKNHKELRPLMDRLHTIAPKSAVLIDKPRDEPDLGLLSTRGEAFTSGGRTFTEMQRNSCHTNTAKLLAAGKIDAIVTGYAMSEPGIGGVWRQHTWGLKGDKIRETTFKYQAYFGVKLNAREAKAFAKGQGVTL